MLLPKWLEHVALYNYDFPTYKKNCLAALEGMEIIYFDSNIIFALMVQKTIKSYETCEYIW